MDGFGFVRRLMKENSALGELMSEIRMDSLINDYLGWVKFDSSFYKRKSWFEGILGSYLIIIRCSNLFYSNIQGKLWLRSRVPDLDYELGVALGSVVNDELPVALQGRSLCSRALRVGDDRMVPINYYHRKSSQN